MKRSLRITHEFVDQIPSNLKDRTIYVSMTYATAIHKCGCGCGSEVVTPLSPKDWKLIFDGESISLHPSIGNWHFDCRSHYWIRFGQIVWANERSDLHDSESHQNFFRSFKKWFDGKTSRKKNTLRKTS